MQRPSPGFILTAVLFCLEFAPGLARAEYFPQFEPGYALQPVEAGQETVSTAASLTAEIAAALGGTAPVYGVIELYAGMARHYSVEGLFDEETGAVSLGEGAIVAEGRSDLSKLEVNYRYPGGRVVMAATALPAEWSEEYLQFSIVSFQVNPDGSAHELARHSVDSEFVGEFFILDMTGDGALEVVIPWATGAGGGGGVAVVTIVPTGGLAGSGENFDEFSLYSRSGYCELADLDADGDWEIQASAPLLCTACGYDVGFVYTYDPALHAWVDGEKQFPASYDTQREFYTKLLTQVKLFMADPAQFLNPAAGVDDWDRYVCTIDGNQHSLVMFAPDADGQFSTAYMWLGALEDFVAGGYLQ